MTYYPDDKDSYNRWIACGVKPSHLIPIEDNFWEIGEGPCGPDSEIFYDLGESRGCGERIVHRAVIAIVILKFGTSCSLNLTTLTVNMYRLKRKY